MEHCEKVRRHVIDSYKHVREDCTIPEAPTSLELRWTTQEPLWLFVVKSTYPLPGLVNPDVLMSEYFKSAILND